jgi:prevent-host-death family protein
METLTANDARVSFGDTLIKAQRSPVQITKSGKPVAVVMSIDDYNAVEELKMRYLKERIKQGEEDIKNGRMRNCDEFFDEILAGKYD